MTTTTATALTHSDMADDVFRQVAVGSENGRASKVAAE